MGGSTGDASVAATQLHTHRNNSRRTGRRNHTNHQLQQWPHSPPAVSLRGRKQQQEPHRPQPQSQPPPAAAGASTAAVTSSGPEHSAAPATSRRSTRTCRNPEDPCSRRRHQQQQGPHHVLCCCHYDQHPSVPTTSQTTRQLICFSRHVPKEIPRPDSYPDLKRSHFEKDGEEGGRREGSSTVGRCRGGGGFMVCLLHARCLPFNRGFLERF